MHDRISIFGQSNQLDKKCNQSQLDDKLNQSNHEMSTKLRRFSVVIVSKELPKSKKLS